MKNLNSNQSKSDRATEFESTGTPRLLSTRLTRFAAEVVVVTLCLAALSASAAMDDGSYDTTVRGTGLYIEPGISYDVMEANANYGGLLPNSGASNRGIGIVLRAGVHVYENFFVAADGRFGILQYSDTANAFSARGPAWNVSPVVGMQMPDTGARFYVGYVLAGGFDPEMNNGKDVKFETPNGWRLGAGLMVRHVSVNVEWQRLHYSSGSLNSSGKQASNIGYTDEGLIASVTFPIQFH